MFEIVRYGQQAISARERKRRLQAAAADEAERRQRLAAMAGLGMDVLDAVTILSALERERVAAVPHAAARLRLAVDALTIALTETVVGESR